MLQPLELLKLRQIVRLSLVKGTSWGPGLGVWLEDLKVGEGLVEIGFKLMEWR